MSCGNAAASSGRSATKHDGTVSRAATNCSGGIEKWCARQIRHSAKEYLRAVVAIQKAVELRPADVKAKPQIVRSTEDDRRVGDLIGVVDPTLRKQIDVASNRTERRNNHLTGWTEVLFGRVLFHVAEKIIDECPWKSGIAAVQQQRGIQQKGFVADQL